MPHSSRGLAGLPCRASAMSRIFCYRNGIVAKIVVNAVPNHQKNCPPLRLAHPTRATIHSLGRGLDGYLMQVREVVPHSIATLDGCGLRAETSAIDQKVCATIKPHPGDSGA